VVPQAAHADALQVCRAAEAATMASLRQLVRRHASATASAIDPRVEHMSVHTSLFPLPSYSLPSRGQPWTTRWKGEPLDHTGETAFKTDVTILSWHTSSLLPLLGPSSLTRSRAGKCVAYARVRTGL